MDTETFISYSSDRLDDFTWVGNKLNPYCLFEVYNIVLDAKMALDVAKQKQLPDQQRRLEELITRGELLHSDVTNEITAQ